MEEIQRRLGIHRLIWIFSDHEMLLLRFCIILYCVVGNVYFAHNVFISFSFCDCTCTCVKYITVTVGLRQQIALIVWCDLFVRACFLF